MFGRGGANRNCHDPSRHSQRCASNRAAIGGLGWVLFAYQLLLVWISGFFFSGFALVLAVVIAIGLGWANWLATTRGRAEQRQSEALA